MAFGDDKNDQDPKLIQKEDSSSNNIVEQGTNHLGNEYTVYKDGQYSYKNFDEFGNVRSHYFNGGSSKINTYHETQRNYSWYENHNTGETNRPTVSTMTQKCQDESRDKTD